MQYKVQTVEEYLVAIPSERKPYVQKLREAVLDNIPKGFEETIQYNMIGYVVPHSIYPDGYHCNPAEPLPFSAIASQKNSINFYHSGIYADEKLKDWFVAEYAKHCTRKLDMGKSCVRFKKFEEIPYKLIGQLMKKIKVKDYIKNYEAAIKK